MASESGPAATDGGELAGWLTAGVGRSTPGARMPMETRNVHPCPNEGGGADHNEKGRPEGRPRHGAMIHFYLQVLVPGFPLQLFEQHWLLELQLWPAALQPPPPPGVKVQLYRASRPAKSSLASFLLSQ